MLALTVVAFAVVAMAAAGGSVHPVTQTGGGWRWEPRAIDSDDIAREPDSGAPRNETPQSTALGDVISVLGQLLVVVVLVALSILVARRLVRLLRDITVDEPPGDAGWVVVAPDGRSHLDDALGHALAVVGADGPVDDAIIACWVGVEDAAADAGVGRGPAETAAELTVRVLGRLAVPADATRRLLALYRTARYSPHPLGEADRRAAVDALHEIRAALVTADDGVVSTRRER